MTTATRAVQKASGWRKAMPEVREKAQALIPYLDKHEIAVVSREGGNVSGADVIRRLLHLLDSADGNVRAEERAAFDSYFAALVSESSSETDVKHAAMVADAMLDERRKRFGGGKDE